MTKLLSKLTISAFALGLSLNVMAQTATSGTLTVTFTETSKTGGYAPRHTLAAWIENSTGTFIKTKIRNAGPGGGTSDHLPTWAPKAGGTAGNCMAAACNTFDAAAAATLASWGTRTFTWDGKNTVKTGTVFSNGTVVPDGTYNLRIESVWSHTAAEANVTIPFTKGTTSFTTTPTVANFSNVSVVWTPDPLGVESATASPLISVYPNPTNGVFTVDYDKAESIKVTNMLGEVVYEQKVTATVDGSQTIDLSSFANGIYTVNVSSSEGSSNYKVMLND